MVDVEVGATTLPVNDTGLRSHGRFEATQSRATAEVWNRLDVSSFRP
jgi:hypothetical protein